MPVALQMPLEVGEARPVGGRLFRKQVLSVGSIPYEGRTLRFDRPYLEQIVENFNAGAFDQVPLVLANAKNEHNEDPDRFRGEVKALELTSGGVDALVELTDDGAELVRKNPRLGVSARLVPEFQRSDGRRFENVMRHVCATLDPKLNGMRPWETVSLSVRWGPQDGDQVIDLSTSSYVPETKTPTLTDDQLDELKGLSGDERAAKARELLGESASEKPDEKKSRFPNLRKLFGLAADTPDAELDSALAKFVEGDEPNETVTTPEADKEREAALASLTAEQRKAIDLANSDAASARKDASAARREVAKVTWESERKELAAAGVPPVLLDLCAPYLSDGQGQVIDLSNGDKFDVSETLRKVLSEAKGYVDLSGERGSQADKDEEAEAKDLASDEKWGASI